ncbi:MAG TPA: DUF3037 domain-containing protein [Acidobacteriaceae bacterium]|nr:DUF3037 domain-containing protein [Acidobacteriaceae bacterium]
MNERVPCEFSLVRYVPDPVKNEFVNIGVMLRDAARPEVAAVRFTRDWARVRCVDPDADIAMLEAMEDEMRRRLLEANTDAVPLLKTIDDSFSHQIQMTASKACLAENLTAEMEELMRLYVEPRRQKARQAVSGRQAIARSMRMHFEHARVWELMRKRIAASAYTQPGDPLKIDCGYRPNGTVRMFHAVSLTGDVELAKVLAFSAPALRAGVARVEGAELELTAIIEPLRNGHGEVTGSEDDVEQYRFGVGTMEAAQIRVLTVNDLERVAETAQRELRV